MSIDLDALAVLCHQLLEKGLIRYQFAPTARAALRAWIRATACTDRLRPSRACGGRKPQPARRRPSAQALFNIMLKPRPKRRRYPPHPEPPLHCKLVDQALRLEPCEVSLDRRTAGTCGFFGHGCCRQRPAKQIFGTFDQRAARRSKVPRAVCDRVTF